MTTPTGRRLMLTRPAKALESGDTIKLTLVLEDGREIEIATPVRRTPDVPFRPSHGFGICTRLASRIVCARST